MLLKPSLLFAYCHSNAKAGRPTAHSLPFKDPDTGIPAGRSTPFPHSNHTDKVTPPMSNVRFIDPNDPHQRVRSTQDPRFVPGYDPLMREPPRGAYGQGFVMDHEFQRSRGPYGPDPRDDGPGPRSGYVPEPRGMYEPDPRGAYEPERREVYARGPSDGFGPPPRRRRPRDMMEQHMMMEQGYGGGRPDPRGMRGYERAIMREQEMEERAMIRQMEGMRRRELAECTEQGWAFATAHRRPVFDPYTGAFDQQAQNAHARIYDQQCRRWFASRGRGR